MESGAEKQQKKSQWKVIPGKKKRWFFWAFCIYYLYIFRTD